MKVRVIGDGVISAGEYEKVTVIGDAKVIDDFRTNKLNVVGDIDSEGDIIAKKAKVVGNLCSNEVNIDEFRLVGNIDTNILTCINTTITGYIKVSNINSNKFITRSSVLEAVEINADIVDLRNTAGEVKSIFGEKIKVYRKKAFSYTSGCINTLTVNEIEGDNIYLENVSAQRVTGDYVEVGPNCNIEYLDSKNKKVHKLSIVKVGGCIE